MKFTDTTRRHFEAKTESEVIEMWQQNGGDQYRSITGSDGRRHVDCM